MRHIMKCNKENRIDYIIIIIHVYFRSQSTLNAEEHAKTYSKRVQKTTENKIITQQCLLTTKRSDCMATSNDYVISCKLYSFEFYIS